VTEVGLVFGQVHRVVLDLDAVDQRGGNQPDDFLEALRAGVAGVAEHALDEELVERRTKRGQVQTILPPRPCVELPVGPEQPLLDQLDHVHPARLRLALRQRYAGYKALGSMHGSGRVGEVVPAVESPRYTGVAGPPALEEREQEVQDLSVGQFRRSACRRLGGSDQDPTALLHPGSRPIPNRQSRSAKSSAGSLRSRAVSTSTG